jgi:hypothetical protein
LSEKFFGLSEKYCPWPPKKHGSHCAAAFSILDSLVIRHPPIVAADVWPTDIWPMDT